MGQVNKIAGLMILFLLGSRLAVGQKIDKEFKAFYTGFQRNIEAGHLDALEQVTYFPFQTIYWIDGMNSFTETEKEEGLMSQEEFASYSQSIYNEQVKRLIPSMEVRRVQQIDVEASGDYYKRLGKLTDPQTTLFELYCQYGENSTVGDDYFAFIFGKIAGEYRILAYYTNTRVKN